MSFVLSDAVDASKIFLTKKSEISGRWDPFYYLPELVELEAKVKSVSQQCLRDFVVRMAGGATPAKKDADTHYTEEDSGIPFIRVQNLTTTGKLNLTDCKRITRGTHEGLLARSRLSGGELLVKITGVGRMAVASVVPEGFEGNINQHMIAIRTKNIETSQILAAYLNLDMTERLASRRSTGGTRPALDYPALLSIPVIFDERILPMMRDAVDKYNLRFEQAKELLAGVDDVLLKELGISCVEEPENTVQRRMYLRKFSEVTGGRFDAPSSWKRLSLRTEKYPMELLKNVALINPYTPLPQKSQETQVSFVPMEAISDIFGEIKENLSRPLFEYRGYTTFQEEDVITAKITPCMENGKAAVARGLKEGFGFGSTEYHVFRPLKQKLNGDYLHCLLRLQTVRYHARLFFMGTAGHQRVDERFYRRLEIPIPPLPVQKQIAKSIVDMYDAARNLERLSQKELEKAKREIEAMILREEVL